MVSKVLCMEIGRKTARIAEVMPGKKNQVTQLFEIEVPPGAFSEGIIRRNKEFIDSVRVELERRSIKTKKVIFTVNSAKIAVRQVSLPKLPEKRIKEALVTNSREYFPLDISEYELGYHILDKVTKGKREFYELSVAVVPKDMVQGYMEMANACGLRFGGIDYVGNSATSLILRQKEERVSVLLKVEEDNILFMVYGKNRILFQRMLPYGLEADVEVDADAMEDMMKNIQNMFNYYNSNVSQDPIQQVFVAGIGSRSAAFMRLLEKFLNMPIQTKMDIRSVSLGGKTSAMDLMEYIAVIGAAYNPLFPVGDEKKGIQEQINVHEATRIPRYVCAALLGVSVLLAALPLAYGAYLKVRIASVNKKIESYAEEQKIYEEYKAACLAVKDVEAMYSHTENQNEFMVELLEDMEKKLPSESRVESMTADEVGVTLNLVLETKEDAAATLVQLRTFPQFSSVVTAGLTEEEEENGTIRILMNVVMTYAVEGGVTDEAVN